MDKKRDAKLEAYNAIKWQDFELLLSLKLSWRSAANPHLDRLMVEVEYLNEITREVLCVQFYHVVQLDMDAVGPSHSIYPLLITNVQDWGWSGVYYSASSEHGELSFQCYDFSFYVIPEREDPYTDRNIIRAHLGLSKDRPKP
jgi:hypothetical protein